MLPELTAEDLIAFEDDVAACFNAAMIKAPIHLYHGNERQMLAVFRDVREDDWVCCSWRSHYQCLLKGVPPERLKADILAGRSIALCYAEQRIVSSAIVGGILPIAAGIALGIKMAGGRERVHCFLGDMTAETGAFHEAWKYARNCQLPIRFVVEDNGKSVCTDTRQAWHQGVLSHEHALGIGPTPVFPCVQQYSYDGSRYPHAGAGTRVQF